MDDRFTRNTSMFLKKMIAFSASSCDQVSDSNNKFLASLASIKKTEIGKAMDGFLTPEVWHLLATQVSSPSPEEPEVSGFSILQKLFSEYQFRVLLCEFGRMSKALTTKHWKSNVEFLLGVDPQCRKYRLQIFMESFGFTKLLFLLARSSFRRGWYPQLNRAVQLGLASRVTRICNLEELKFHLKANPVNKGKQRANVALLASTPASREAASASELPTKEAAPVLESSFVTPPVKASSPSTSSGLGSGPTVLDSETYSDSFRSTYEHSDSDEEDELPSWTLDVFNEMCKKDRAFYVGYHANLRKRNADSIQELKARAKERALLKEAHRKRLRQDAQMAGLLLRSEMEFNALFNRTSFADDFSAL